MKLQFQAVWLSFLLCCLWTSATADDFGIGCPGPFDGMGGPDYGSYTTEIYQYCNLQIGYTEDANETYNFPEGHIDEGKNVAAYYYWVFPNMMFNFYPWGLSINVVKPISIDRTKVSFISYVFDPEKLEKGAGQALDKVEREDEFVVENVQKGILSSFYRAGRFSPEREKGVHHFHRLLADFLNR